VSAVEGNGAQEMPAGAIPVRAPVVSLDRRFIPAAAFRYARLAEVCPGVGVQMADGSEPMALMFELPNQEQLIFLLEEPGRKALITQLTGGVEIAHSLPPRPAGADG
jgi:hypothetical protein